MDFLDMNSKELCKNLPQLGFIDYFKHFDHSLPFDHFGFLNICASTNNQVKINVPSLKRMLIAGTDFVP